MKKITQTLAAVAMSAFLLVGCATTPTSSNNLQNALTAIRVVVPVAVEYAVLKDTNNIQYFRLAAEIIDASAAGPNFNPTQLMAALNSIPQVNTSPEAKLAVVAAIGIYQGFFAQQVTSNADTTRVLQAIASSIRIALPPNKSGKILRTAKNAWRPAASRPEAMSTPERIWEGAKAPWVAKSPDGALFHAKETTISMAGSYTLPQNGINKMFERGFNDGTYGFNLATTYWLNNYFGAGIETGVTDIYRTSSALFSYTGLTAYGRFPIGPVAPYVAGVVGRNFNEGAYYVEPRLGLEVRVTTRVGCFADAGYVWQTTAGNEALQTRFGINFVF